LTAARLVLDRTTVVALAAGLVMLQLLIFSAGFLFGAAEGLQVLTPPPPVRPSPPASPERRDIRLASLTAMREGKGRGGGLPVVAAVSPQPERPSPLVAASFLVPPPKIKAKPPAPPRLPRSAAAYAAMIREAAKRHSVSPALVEAIARVESGFNSRAVSHKGARGLMQVMPATGRRFGVRSDRLFDPEHNLNAGVAYLAWLSKRYRGDLDLITAAYNAGEGAVDDYGGIPPYRETRDYVRKVKGVLRTIEARELPADPPTETEKDQGSGQ
jgi:soluble lytic murein transglycosylase-like protein